MSRLLPIGTRTTVIFAGIVLLVCTSLLVAELASHFAFMFDFKGDLYNAGRAILQGENPYHPGFLAAQAALLHAGGASASRFAVPVYTAPALVAVVPLSLLPFWLAGGLFAVLSTSALIVGLRLLGVRDWRCLVLAVISWPFLFGLYVGNLGPLIVLGAAIAWRWRERLWPPAIAIASIVVAKLFPWPLVVWLLVTKRFRALSLTVVIGVVVVLAGWAAIGFAGMTAYPRMLSNLAVVEEGHGPSLVALLLTIGVSAEVAKVVALATAAALLGAAWSFVGRPDGDRRAFGLAVMAALTASPIVWEHYLVLLFVPIALMSPRLSPIWFIPVLTSLVGFPSAGNAPEILFWIVLEALVVARLCWRVPGRARARRPLTPHLGLGRFSGSSVVREA